MKVKQINIYPIKGLTGHSLLSVSALSGLGFSMDRSRALMFTDTQRSPGDRNLTWVKKRFLANQNDWPALASLDCHFDEKIENLKIFEKQTCVLDVALAGEDNLTKIDQFFTDFLSRQTPFKLASHPQKAPVKIVGTPSASSRYPDSLEGDISIINLASIRDVEVQLGQHIAPERFRGNLTVEGLNPWDELSWIGRKIRIGSIFVEIVSNIGRCSNVNVNPKSGVSDLEVLKAVSRSKGKGSMGIYAKIVTSGSVNLGDEIFLA